MRTGNRKAYCDGYVADCSACRCFPARLAALPELRLGPQQVFGLPQQPQLRFTLAVLAEQSGDKAAPPVPWLRHPVVDRHSKSLEAQ
jgi:hypothetical protein